ncbi:MAG: HalOD1 output domain-containing protein [Haloplanus sp.]
MSVEPTVLHVDDDTGILDLSDAWFRSRDDVVWRTTDDPETALSMLADGVVDCLVSDSLRLPDGDSFVARAGETAPDLPIILFTASDHDDVDESARAVAARHVKKGPATQFTNLYDHIRLLTAGGPSRGDPASTPTPRTLRRPHADADDWTQLGRYDWESDERIDLGTAILDALDAYGDEDEDDPMPTLYEYVDAESLEELLEPRPDGSKRPGVRVQFIYDDAELAVTNEGFILARST